MQSGFFLFWEPAAEIFEELSMRYTLLALTVALSSATAVLANDYHKAAARFAAGCSATNVILISESNNGGTTWLVQCGLGDVVVICSYEGQCHRAS